MITLLLFLSACSASLESSSDDDAFVLTTYDVPVGYESRVEEALNRAFYRGEGTPSAGRALEGAPGSVIVAAPESAQEDLAAVIARLAKADPKPTQPQNIRLTYWMVSGKPAAATDTSALPPVITAAMTEVAASEPPMRYEVMFHESLLSLDGAHAKGAGDTWDVGQVASITPQGVIVADIDFQMQGGAGAETRVQLVPGQVLVMGQTAGSGAALFYVVRPEPTAAQ